MVYYLSGGNRKFGTVSTVMTLDDAKVVGYRLMSSHKDWDEIYVTKKRVEDIMEYDPHGEVLDYATASIHREPNNKYGTIYWINWKTRGGVGCYYLFRDGSTVECPNDPF